MADEPEPGERPLTILHSPERSWRGAGCVLVAVGAAWQSAVHDRSAVGLAVSAVFTAVLLAVAWRLHRSRLVVDSRGLTDYRVIRTVRVSWDDVASFEVGRPDGPWGGFCVRVVRRTGKPVDLLATQGYALFPSRSGYDEVHRMMWTLEELRPTVPE